MTSHGEVHWSELISADVKGSKAYFQAICGWTISEMPMPDGTYSVCMAGEKPVAGILDVKQIQADHEISPHWMTYLHVDDVDGAVAATAENGGTVVRPPFDVPGVGRIAMVMDPGKAIVGIMTPAST